jgi:hypothetical protein
MNSAIIFPLEEDVTDNPKKRKREKEKDEM